MSQEYQIVSPELTVKAMRDSGYRNTAYALAELIDNSIDAEADLVEVFVCEEDKTVEESTRRRVDRIAVLDNGLGMDHDTLRRALKYGDSRKHRQAKIGKFGMGLPNSSMSQCRFVEVWSWQNGPANSLYTYLRLEEISKGIMREVPDPVYRPVPQEWQDLGQGLGEHGTLVVWNDLDRVQWFGAAATLNNTEQLIGRVYRYFICEGATRIRLVPVEPGGIVKNERDATPNDPLYLVSPSCAPVPFRDRPMFAPIPTQGDDTRPGEFPFPIEFQGREYHVMVRASIATEAARNPDHPDAHWPEKIKDPDAGNQSWGKHAEKNIGVSLVREGRELDLDRAWTISYDPRERWWGLEVHFSRDLDDVFGVTNTKQNATIFSALATFNWEDERLDGESWQEFLHRLSEAQDARLPLIELSQTIHRTMKSMRGQIHSQRQGARGKRHTGAAEKVATDALNKRREENHLGTSDHLEETLSPQEAVQQQVDSLVHNHRLAPDEASKIVEEDRKANLRARWISTSQDTTAFFSVESQAAMLQVSFNSGHRLHKALMQVLEEVPPGETAEQLRHRLENASYALRLLLFSWGRYEEELPDNDRETARKARQDWGLMATKFLPKDQ